jgi:hypothetical protein
LFNASGTKRNREFVVSGHTAGQQVAPTVTADTAVASNAAASFVVGEADNASGHWQILTSQFDSGGNSIDQDITINLTNAAEQQNPSVIWTAGSTALLTGAVTARVTARACFDVR